MTSTSSLSAGARDHLVQILTESRSRGFLGPGAVEYHIEHALAFKVGISRASVPDESPYNEPSVDDGGSASTNVGPSDERLSILDLGSGGGIPGLVLALALPVAELCLLDANSRRCAFLREAIERLGVTDRVRVLEGRAEELARRSDLRHRFRCVVARSFGAPGVLAECAVGFMLIGGVLVVSEPPSLDDPAQALDRWDEHGLNLLGLRSDHRYSDAGASFPVIRADEQCQDRYPRRNGVPGKRPLS